MPPTYFIVLLACVIAAAALTVWLFQMAGPTALLLALPAFMVATAVLRRR